MEKLNEELDRFVEKLSDSNNFKEEIESVKSVYPFSRYEYIISKLLVNKVLTYEQYIYLRDSYIDRNLFLYVFEISAPRGFGDTWAFGHLTSVESELKRPSKKVDPDYSGQYDLYVEKGKQIIKVEVKASRCVDRERPDEPLYVKALSSDTKRPFLMNFQQLKPSCCDVFLWVAVYRDTVRYWVLNSEVVRQHNDFTPQHRNAETADRETGYKKADIYEGQIMITEKNIGTIKEYLTTGKKLHEAILKCSKE